MSPYGEEPGEDYKGAWVVSLGGGERKLVAESRTNEKVGRRCAHAGMNAPGIEIRFRGAFFRGLFAVLAGRVLVAVR
jgi:hypothetical protein